MNLNSKPAYFTIPVFCKHEAVEIRNIETAANKALQNIHSLYDEIMMPKANTGDDYSSDSTSVSIGYKNSFDSNTGVSELLLADLCSKCKKLVSLSSAHSKQDSSILQNHKFLQERANSYPCLKPFCRTYFSEQNDSPNQEQPSQINTSQERRESHHQEECVPWIPHYLEVRRNSPHPVEGNFYYPEKIQRQNKSSFINSIDQEQNIKNLHERNSYYSESNTKYTLKSLKESNQFSITVPTPFSLVAKNVNRQEAKEEKITKLREEINSQIEKELNFKFFPKPVPKHVRLPLYGEMVKMNEKKKKERKEKCIEIINRKTKPFNLSTSIQTCVSKSVSDLPQKSNTFKAKPVPQNILSENISQKIKTEEEIRKLLIAQRAEEMLKKSSLPFSPKPVHHSLSLFDISDSMNKNNINVTKEMIKAITNRLYDIKCRERIENWNEKVMQNDFSNASYQKSSNNEKKNCKSAYPFHNFPVRMTTATFLRGKQIRADIESRKGRQETNKSITEETSQRRKETLKNVWPRLKSAEQMHNIRKEIEEKVNNYRKSQKNREQEYEKELEDMMKRVSKQFLLIERQSKETKRKIDTNRSVDELLSNKGKSRLENSGSPASSVSVKSNSPTTSDFEKSDST